MSEIDEIKARLDIVDLISQSVNLRRSGKNYVGFCPFHANTRTPAFYVFPESGTWHCFGCHEGGDIFSFMMKKESMDFKETLQRLAQQAGVELRPRSPQAGEGDEKHAALRALLAEAATFFQHHLRSTYSGKSVLAYLQKRGLSDAAIEQFQLGYAPDAWDTLSIQFTKQGHSPDELVQAGLASERDSGGVYDRFRHRLMFPIRDEKGNMAGFGARSLREEDLPKYLNSPQTAIFDKSHLLYGLDLARKSIRTQDQAVIVEGYMDVIGLHMHGFTNAISPMGTALNENQLRLLKRFTKRIVLALDADVAGQRATLRGLEVARQTLDHQTDAVFDAHGLLRHEARLQADIRVATLPAGLDPDEVVKQNPDEWNHIIENAKPIVAHVMDVLCADKNLDDPKEKNLIAQQVLQLIEDLPNSFERETYRQRLARLLHVDERALLGFHLRPARRIRGIITQKDKKSGQVPSSELPIAQPSTLERESYLLGVLLREPGTLFYLDRALQENGLARISAQDFQRADFQQIFYLLRQSLEQDETEPYQYIQNKLPPLLMEVADRLLTRTEKLNPAEVRVAQEVLRILASLRRENYQRQKLAIDDQINEAQDEKDDEAIQNLMPLLRECLQNIALYDRA